MKIPIRVIHKDEGFAPIKVKEYAIMPSEKIVVMIEDPDGYPESFWFYNDGNNPKSYLEFLEVD